MKDSMLYLWMVSILSLIALIVLTTESRAEDGKLSTSKSSGSSQIQVIVAPRIEFTKEGIKTNISVTEFKLRKEGSVIILEPKS